jgi:hypothetical protein
MRTAESRKGGHAQAVCGARCGPGGGRREAGGGRGPLSLHTGKGATLQRWVRARRGVERTSNVRFMSVTSVVSQLFSG